MLGHNTALSDIDASDRFVLEVLKATNLGTVPRGSGNLQEMMGRAAAIERLGGFHSMKWE